MEGILSIVILVALGFVLTKRGWFSGEVIAFIPKFVTSVALPPLMFYNLTSEFDSQALIAAAYGFVVPFTSILLCIFVSILVSYLLKIPYGRQGVFRVTFSFSNAVFIGIPVNLALFGEQSLPYSVLYFVSSVALFWTVGYYLICKDGDMKDAKLFSAASVKGLFSPPLIGFLVAIVIILADIPVPDFISNTAKYLGNMTTPFSLLFIGVIIFGAKLKDLRFSVDIFAVLAGRFVVAPLLVLLMAHFIPIPLLMKKVFVIQSSLPAVAQSTIVAKLAHADAEYAAMLVGITTVLAVFSIPFYMMII